MPSPKLPQNNPPKTSTVPRYVLRAVCHLVPHAAAKSSPPPNLPVPFNVPLLVHQFVQVTAARRFPNVLPPVPTITAAPAAQLIAAPLFKNTRYQVALSSVAHRVFLPVCRTAAGRSVYHKKQEELPLRPVHPGVKQFVPPHVPVTVAYSMSGHRKSLSQGTKQIRMRQLMWYTC